MERIQSVQNSFVASAIEMRGALSDKKNDVQRIAEENVGSYLKQATDLKNNVIERTAEYQKLAGDTTSAYIGQAAELKRTVTGKAEHYKVLASATVCDQAENLKASSAGVVCRVSTFTERVAPITVKAKEQVNATLNSTAVFIDDRAKECLNKDESYTTAQYYGAALRSSVSWSRSKFHQVYNQCMAKIDGLRPDILSEKFVEGSMFYYVQWAKVAVVSACNSILTRLPINEKALFATYNNYSTSVRSYSMTVIEGIQNRAEVPLKTVIDKCEPLREVLSEKSAQVEVLVKHQNINELVEKSVSSAKEFLYGNRVEGVTDPSDTTIASPIEY